MSLYREQTSDDVIELLQGEWADVTDHNNYFKIEGKDIVDIEGFGEVTKATFNIGRNQSGKLTITVRALNWINEDLFSIDRTTFSILALGNTLGLPPKEPAKRYLFKELP